MRRQDKQPPKTKKYFRKTESGAGMTKAGVARQNLILCKEKKKLKCLLSWLVAKKNYYLH